MRSIGSHAKRAWDLLNLSRNQLWMMMGLLMEHWNLKGHLFTLGLEHSPRRDR